MPINKINEYVTLMQDALDQHMVQTATSGWMEANSGQIKYEGGKYVKLPNIATTGLADYDRDEGFNKMGSVTLSWDQHEMTMDRGTSFQLDAMDVNETNFTMNATTTAKVFQETQVVPEVDAYRYSTLQNIADGANQTEEVALTTANVLGKFREHVRAVEDYMGYGTPLVCTLTSEVLALLEDSDKFSRNVNISEFAQGKLNLKLKAIDNVVFRVVPSARMMSAYLYKDGTTEFGFAPNVGAAQIQWIICPVSTPIAVSRTDKLRVFEPNVNQRADAWKIDYRKYHDLWVKKSREKSLMTCTAPVV